MPRSKKTLLKEQLQSLLRAGDRHVDTAIQFRVYRCSCGVAHADWPKGKDHGKHQARPAETIGPVYGQRYDRLLRKYVAPASSVYEVKVHEGQAQLVTLSGLDAYDRPIDERGVLRVLALGSPGAGKTMGAVALALRLACERPNSTGGLIGPTNDRRKILWDSFLEICPPAWVEDVSVTRKEIRLVNGNVIQVLAAKSPSQQFGSPLQGRSFDWCVVDESQNVTDESHTEIATRGRRAGSAYRIIETATNQQIPSFRVRLAEFKQNPQYRRINFTGYQNPWVEPEWWQKMRGEMSERDFREKILAEDVPPERLVYPRFNLSKHVARRGFVPGWFSDIERKRLGELKDVTEHLTYERFNKASRYVIAQDFGVLINAAEVLKCYQARTGDRFWWAVDEITSGGGTDLHAYKLRNYYDPEECVVIADPHFNSKESDKSDYNIMREMGWDVYPATHGRISVKHRVAMFNALLEDAEGKTRFFIDCDEHGAHRCPRLVQSLISSQMNELGEAEKDKKNGASDPSHWPSAVQFGLFHWERSRGNADIRVLSPGDGKKKWWEEA